MKRRMLLATSAGALAGTAGCLGIDPTSGSPLNGGDDEANSGNGTEAIEQVTLTTTGSDCGSPESEQATLVSETPGYVVVGAMQAPNPCHEVTLEETSYEDATVSLTLDVEARTGDQECIQCHGEIQYRAVIEPAESTSVDAVVVNHNNGETFELQVNDDWPSVTTQETGCAADYDDDVTSVTIEEETLVIDGTRPSPDPCHEAIITGYQQAAEHVTITIDVKSQDDVDLCAECVGTVDYQAAVPIEPDSINSVTVTHTGGDTHERLIEEDES